MKKLAILLMFVSVPCSAQWTSNEYQSDLRRQVDYYRACMSDTVLVGWTYVLSESWADDSSSRVSQIMQVYLRLDHPRYNYANTLGVIDSQWIRRDPIYEPRTDPTFKGYIEWCLEYLNRSTN